MSHLLTYEKQIDAGGTSPRSRPPMPSLRRPMALYRGRPPSLLSVRSARA